MPMSDETKARLRAAGAAKRARTVLLKDLTPAQLAVACDHARDRGLAPLDTLDPECLRGHTLAYLSRATAEQLEALKAQLPYGICHFSGYVGSRYMFRDAALREILRFLGMDAGRIMRCVRFVRWNQFRMPGLVLDAGRRDRQQLNARGDS